MKNNFISQKGSIMIEALAMLGLIAMVTPVLYRKAAERTTELQDINVSSQIRMVSQAVDAYLKDHYNELKGDDALTTGELDADRLNAIQEYLPEGFSLNQASKLFNNFKIAVHREGPDDKPVYTSAVVASLRNDMTKSRAAKIATMVGVAGGLYENNKFQGSQGAWTVENPTANDSFGFDFTGDNAVRENSIVSISNDAINSVVGTVDPNYVLYRRPYQGNTDYNTMHTTLYMGGNNIEMGGGDINNVNNITMSGRIFSNGPIISYEQIDGALPTHTHKLSEITDIDTDLVMGQHSISAQNGVFSDEVSVSGKVTADKFVGNEAEIDGVIINSSGINATGKTIIAQKGIFNELELNGDLDMKTNDIKNVDTIDAQTGIFNQVETSGLSADTIHAHNELTVGGGDGSPHPNGEYNRYLYVGSDGFDTTTTLLVNQSGIRVNPGNDKSGHKQLNYTDDGLVINHNDVDNDGIQSSNNSLQFGNGLSVHNQAYTGNTYNNDFTINYSGMTFTSNNSDKIQYKNGNLVVGGSGANAINDIGAATEVDSSYSYDGNNVIISRDGVIKLVSPAGTSGNTTTEGLAHGYIQARRLVSDIPFNRGSLPGGHADAWQAKTRTFGNTSGYTQYQVNPAYTSVMNDIKLATRGGARLSDILPDYINKGIYIADNTFRENSETGGIDALWPDSDVLANRLIEIMNSGTGTTGAGCPENGVCTASPWLGFIPYPQCPPAYERVITIEPFRWKMSEIYNIVLPSGATSYNFTMENPNAFDYTGGRNSTGSATYGPTGDFYNLFNEYSPTFADIEARGYGAAYSMSTSEVNANGEHSHDVTVGKAPLIFQANTWLNTTMKDVNCKAGDPCGWSVVMGFLYPISKYSDLKNLLGIRDTEGYAWNLFPVAERNMAAVVRVYCSFNRRDNSNPSNPWKWNNQTENPWQSDSPVYRYDQLYRALHHTDDFIDNHDYKDDGWVKQVNDPSLDSSLGYDEAW